MQKEIKLQEQKVSYTLKMSKRAKQLRLTIQVDGGVIVTAPARTSFGFIERAIISKGKWILEKLDYFKSKLEEAGVVGKKLLPRITRRQARAHYLEHKEIARKLAYERVNYFNAIYGFRVGKISIKNTKSRWGSCSKKGNLNFNYKIALLPPRHADYIVVHELCHLGQFNHSKKFWALVAQSIPEYDIIHRELKRYQFTLS